MEPYRKLRVERPAKAVKPVSAEERYWNSFTDPLSLTHTGKVTDVHFSSSKSSGDLAYDFVVSSGTSLSIYDGKSKEVRRTISRFKNTVYSGSYRYDGKLIVAGGEERIVRVYEAATRSQLREFKGHKDAVHATHFSWSELTQVASAGDDRVVALWDIPKQKRIVEVSGHHTDFIRSLAQHPTDANLWFSGSYDHTVCLFDARDPRKAVAKLEHDAPVEDLVINPSGTMLFSCAGPEIRAWDLVSGSAGSGRLQETLSHHHKTITAIAFDPTNSQRLLSASVDQHVKVYDLATFEVTHTRKYAAPILSLAVSPDARSLVVGMTDGSLNVRQRRVTVKSTAPRKAAKFGQRFFTRGANYQSTSDLDVKVEITKQPKLTEYDRDLKRFRYRDALDRVIMSKDTTVPVAIAMIQELVERDGLHTALKNRNEKALAPILTFLVKNIQNPVYTELLIDVASVVIDLYETALGESPVIDRLFEQLRIRLDQEVGFQTQLLKFQGALDLLLSTNSLLPERASVPSPSPRQITAASASSSEDAPMEDDSDHDSSDSDGESQKVSVPSSPPAASPSVAEAHSFPSPSNITSSPKSKKRRRKSGKASSGKDDEAPWKPTDTDSDDDEPMEEAADVSDVEESKEAAAQAQHGKKKKRRKSTDVDPTWQISDAPRASDDSEGEEAAAEAVSQRVTRNSPKLSSQKKKSKRRASEAAEPQASTAPSVTEEEPSTSSSSSEKKSKKKKRRKSTGSAPTALEEAPAPSTPEGGEKPSKKKKSSKKKRRRSASAKLSISEGTS